MAEYKLSASLSEHDDDVRAVVFPDSKAVISASRDGTVRFWKLLSTNPPTFDATISSHASSFVNAVAYLPPTRDHAEGLIISGGKDTLVDVRPPSKTPDDNAEALLIGHSNNICALDVDPEGKYIVSGSWDREARIWPVGKWECEAVLTGHEGSVWAVLAYDSETIITACADKFIRIFHRSGKLLRTLGPGEDVVRALCRLEKDHISGADFASAGNDTVIRLWTISGRQWELISSGEDRTLRIWKGYECIQTITHPAISVWGVAVCAENGDIVTGASDRVVRVFTRSSERYASAEIIQQFDTSVKESSIPQQALNDKINKEKLPGPEFLQQKSGTKEGQVQMITQPSGSVTAHMWSGGQWVDVGTVVDAAGSSGKKVEYAGQSYDYVFDVDIEDGKPPLKLPYNLSQNPYEAATKFVQDNELPITYLDQVANFITTNTQAASIGQSAQSSGPEAWGSENRYRPGGSTNTTDAPARPPPTAKLLPQKTYLSILNTSLAKVTSKIQEINTSLLSTGQKDVSLNSTELSILADLRKYLESSTNTSTNKSPPSIPPGGLPLALKISTKWPYNHRLPGLDLLRLLALSPQTAAFKNVTMSSNIPENIIDLVILALRPSETDTPPAKNHTMMVLRFFANLFSSPEGRSLAFSEFTKIQDLVENALKGTGKGDRNTEVATATVWINYAVLLSSEVLEAVEGKGEENFEKGLRILEGAKSLLGNAAGAEGTDGGADGEVVFRVLVAVGTMVGAGEEILSAAKDVLGLGDVVKKVEKGKVASSEKRVNDLAGEVVGLFH